MLKQAELAYLLWKLGRFAVAHSDHFQQVADKTCCELDYGIASFQADQVAQYVANYRHLTIDEYVEGLTVKGDSGQSGRC